MARIKYFNPNTGKWEYADSQYSTISGGDTDHPDWSHLKWYVMGDSLTARNSDHAEKRYYDFVQEKTGVQIIVDGVGGTGYGAGVSNTQSFLDRVKEAFPEDDITKNADVDIVTIFGSGNDIRYGVDYNRPIYDTLAHLCTKRPGMRVIVVPPSPWKHQGSIEEEINEWIGKWKAYCTRLKETAATCNFRYASDMADCPPFNPNFTGHMEKFFTTDTDGIHPNEAGHEALATYFYNALAQELEFDAGSGNYVLTSADKTDIAEMVSELVEVPSDEHINSLINAALGVIENGTY